MSQPPQHNPAELHALENHAIIAGFGVPGRAVADVVVSRGMAYCVIELNAETVTRCTHGGVPIILGDGSDEEALRRAGIERAALFAATMPNDRAVLEAVLHARRLNPTARILARCHYVSTGMEATRRGADQVIVAEQVVAAEMVRVMEQDLRLPAPAART